MSGIAKTKVLNTISQWPSDKLNMSNDNAQVEGGSMTYNMVTPPTRQSNITQIFEKTFAVSSTDRWVKGAGVNDQFLYQAEKALKEIATDIEHALLMGSLTSGNDTGPRRMAGAFAFVTTNATAVASGTPLGETLYNALLQMAWVSGGNPDEAYMGPFLKRKINAYTAGTATQRTIAADDKRLVNSVDVYESSFSIQKLFLSMDVPPFGTGRTIGSTNENNAILIIENSRWKMAIGEPIHRLPDEEVAQDIRGTKGVIRGELTLQCLADPANALATGLETT
jgi:hypothetical protein